MAYTLFGLLFLIQAILHALGSPLFLGHKYRDSDWGRPYQRGLVLPYALLGSGWVMMGTLYYALYDGRATASFYIWLGGIFLATLVLLVRNRQTNPQARP